MNPIINGFLLRVDIVAQKIFAFSLQVVKLTHQNSCTNTCAPTISYASATRISSSILVCPFAQWLKITTKVSLEFLKSHSPRIIPIKQVEFSFVFFVFFKILHYHCKFNRFHFSGCKQILLQCDDAISLMRDKKRQYR